MAKLFDFKDYILPAKLIPRFLHPDQHLFDKPAEIDGRATGTQCGHGVLIPGRQIYESNFDKRLWRPMDQQLGGSTVMETVGNLRPNFVCEELSEQNIFMGKLLSIIQSGIIHSLCLAGGEWEYLRAHLKLRIFLTELFPLLFFFVFS